jgi:hypothetical protein
MSATELDAVIAGRRDTDRGIYTWAAVVAALVVLAGFARTYYAKTAFATPELRPLLHLHGLVMTAWFGLFIVQVRLAATQRLGIHRRLGIYGMVVAALVVVVGTVTAITAAALGHAPPGAPPPLVFLAIPIGDVTLFTILVSAAFVLRRRPEYHKRLMVVASLGILTAAIARIPIDSLQAGGLPAFFALTDVIVLTFVAADTIKHRRLHPAYAWGFGAVLLSQVARFAGAGTPQWLAFATWLTSL